MLELHGTKIGQSSKLRMRTSSQDITKLEHLRSVKYIVLFVIAKKDSIVECSGPLSPSSDTVIEGTELE